ncbi:Uncharacterized protein DAT39_007611, partial [Clarias magur]
ALIHSHASLALHLSGELAVFQCGISHSKFQSLQGNRHAGPVLPFHLANQHCNSIPSFLAAVYETIASTAKSKYTWPGKERDEN